jgi:hypothetical protein
MSQQLLDTAVPRRLDALTDGFLESYVCWREESAAARGAYELWRDAGRPDQALAFAAYRAALDREEEAARLLRESTELISAEVSGARA